MPWAVGKPLPCFLAGQTAAQALNKAEVKEGDVVLILAGAGGVGHLAVQGGAAKAEVYTAKVIWIIWLPGAHAINYQFAPVAAY